MKFRKVNGLTFDYRNVKWFYDHHFKGQVNQDFLRERAELESKNKYTETLFLMR